MTRKKQGDKVRYYDLIQKRQVELELPRGIRWCDLEELSEVERDLLHEIKVRGRKTRYFFKVNGLEDELSSLKTRGLIEPVRLNSNYAYDLTKTARELIKRMMI